MTAAQPSTACRSAVLGLAVVLSACSSGGAPTTNPAAPDRFGAPVVERPRDISQSAGDPCTRLLTPNQRSDLGIAMGGRVRTNAVGAPECRWDDSEAALGVSLTAYAREDILVDSYRNRIFPIFRPTTVGGLPAVAQQSSSTTVSCTVTVGTAEGQGFDVTYDIFDSDGSSPCDGAHRVAEMVVANLPEQAPK